MSGLRQRCERLLDDLPVPRPFDLARWSEVVAQHRGRRLHLQPMPGLSRTAPCGMWISTRSTDYIFFEANTSPLHAEHIILHEIAHVLSGHTLGAEIADSVLGGLLPDLDPASIHRILGRVGYASEQEREAEMFATLVHARAGSQPPSRQDQDQELAHMAAVLHFPV